jgi:hypothetical protein
MPASVASEAVAEHPRADRYGDALPKGAIARLGTLRHGHIGRVSNVAFTPDGRYVVTRDDLSALIWDARTGRLLRRFPDDLPKKETALLNDDAATGRHAAADKLPRTLLPSGRNWPEEANRLEMLRDRRLLDRDGKPAFEKMHGEIHEVHESPGGRYVGVTGIMCGVVRQGIPWLGLWDGVTRRLIVGLDTTKEGVESIGGFSADGRTFVSTSRRTGTIRLWESATGRERVHLVGHLRGEDVTVGFRSDGRVLVSGGSDTQVFLWDVTGRSPDGVRHETRHSRERMRDLWKALAGDDAAEAYRAIWALIDAPAQTVTWMREHLPPIAPVQPRQLARLIADLDSDEFAVRSKATEELERLGELAEKALRGRLAGKPTLECRRRCEELLAKLSVLSGERLRAVRAVEVLEHLGAAEARTLLEKWRRGAPQARLTQEARAALERLAAP